MPPRPNEARREQLLDELEALILEEGFAHLRVGALADRLHCSRSTLYKLAECKEGLIRMVFERYVERAFRESSQAAATATSAVDKISRYSEMVDRYQSAGSDVFWRDINADPHMLDIFTLGRAQGYRAIRGYLDEGIEQGDFRPTNTAFVAYMVWQGAAATRDPDIMTSLGVDRHEAVQQMLDLLVYGMGRNHVL